jgi:hypothetical protein
MIDPSIQVFPIHPWHVQVAQDHVVAVLSEQVEGFTPIRGGVPMMTVPPQREVKQFPDVPFIFNDQDVAIAITSSPHSEECSPAVAGSVLTYRSPISCQWGVDKGGTGARKNEPGRIRSTLFDSLIADRIDQ